MTPQQWNIYVVDLEPRVGTKPGKQRPVIAVQPTEFGEAGLESTVVVPLTSKVANLDAWPLRVRIPAGICGLTHESDAMIDQMLSWDNQLFMKDLGVLPLPLVDQVKKALREFLDL